MHRHAAITPCPELHVCEGQAESPGLLRCWAAGLLAGRGEGSHAGLALVFHPSLKRHDHLSIQALFPSVCFWILVLFFVLCCRGRNPGPHTCWVRVLPSSYTPDLPVSVCIPLKHLRA